MAKKNSGDYSQERSRESFRRSLEEQDKTLVEERIAWQEEHKKPWYLK